MSRAVPEAVFEPFRRTDQGVRCCQFPGCREEGEYRAPIARDRLTDYYWFCLDHVRAYNAAWNFYAGMSEADIERHKRHDTVWRRPSWPFGGPTYKYEQQIDEELRRHFSGIFDDTGPGATRRQSDREKALSVLDLEPQANDAEIKARYKKLVKQLHPDANGGDTEAEERLKAVNLAYAVLKGG